MSTEAIEASRNSAIQPLAGGWRPSACQELRGALEPFNANPNEKEQMKNWTIGKRIKLGFAAIIGIAVMLGGAGYYNALKGARDIGELGLVELPSVQYLQVIKIGGEKVTSAQQSLLQWGLAPAVRAREHESIAKIRAEYGAAWKAYELLPKSAEDQKLWAELQTPWEQWRAANTDSSEWCKNWKAWGSVIQRCWGNISNNSEVIIMPWRHWLPD